MQASTIRIRRFLAILFSLALTQGLLAQATSVAGTVEDETGSPMIGVTVVEQGTTNGTITDVAGQYELNLEEPGPDSRLVFSYTGYQPQTVEVGDRTTIDVMLVEGLALDEVVVVGYGTQRRADLTGSVSSISDEEVAQVPVLTADQAMQGRAAGVDVRQTSSVPGGDVRVRIRGINSINGNNDPLYVIDGVIGGNINTVHPDDIKSIDILKDAAAASIYGARGANGVIMITTKSGEQGRPRVSFDAWYGLDQPGELFDMMGPREYMEYVNEADELNNTGVVTYPDIDGVLAEVGAGTAWQDEFYRTGTNQKYHLSLNGGNETLTYMASGSYQRQEGVVPTSDFTRYTARVNLNLQASERLSFGANMSYVHTIRNTFQEDANNGFPRFRGPVSWTVANPPILSPYDADGNLIPIINNPYAAVGVQPYNNGIFALNNQRESLRDLIQLNFFADWKILEPLSFRITFGTQPTISENRFFTPFEVPNEFQEQFRAASKSINRNNMWLVEPTLTYENRFADRHALKVVVGSSSQKNWWESSSLGSQDFPFDFVTWNAIQAGDPNTYNLGSGLTEQQYQGFFGRLNYSFDDKYLLQVNGRYDGASNLAEDNRWAFFPSVSVGWRLSQEPFLEDSPLIDNLKLRASYGSIGSYATPPYATIPQLGTTGWDRRYGFGDQQVFVYVADLANPDLRWETTTQFDIGLDLALLNGRIGFTADYYNKKTSDLILNQLITIVNNAWRDHDPDITQNIGSMRNTGVELNLNYFSPAGPAFRWDANLNMTFQSNEVLDLALEEGQEYLDLGNNLIRNYHRLEPGEPFGNYAGYRTNGLFQDQAQIDGSAQPNAQPGDVRYVDVNGDGTINENDKTVVGNAYPDMIAGLTNTFRWKGVELSFLLYGAFGQQMFNWGAQRMIYGLNAVEWNKLAQVATDRWTGPNTSNEIPRAGYALINGTDGPNGTIDLTTEDASFVKLRNLTLAYNFPKRITQRLGMENLRLYVKGQNLLVFTEYSGYDPEASNFRSAEVFLPVETLFYPFVRSYLFGVNVQF